MRFFTEHADGSEWLNWLTGQPSFAALFEPSASPSAVSEALAIWFVDRFVMNEARSASALELLAQNGGRMSAQLWNTIGGRIHAGPAPRPEWLNPWLTILLRDPPAFAHEWLEYALMACRWPQDRAIALALFDHLTQPHPSLHGSYGPLSVRTGVEFAGTEHWLRDAWEQILLPHVDDIAMEVIAMADHHLRRANQLLRAAGAAGDAWDPLSRRRSAIEPNPQDNYPDPIDVLIDAARDAIVHQVEHTPATAHGWLEAWQDSAVPLLRRLATHAWVVRSEKSIDDKLAWLKSKNLLYASDQHHEVYQLLKAVHAASAEAIDGLLADVLEGPDDAGDYRNYAILNLLAWLHRHATGNDAVQSAYDAFRADNEGVEPSEHPEYVSWSESGTIGLRPPMSPDTLHDRLSRDPSEVVGDLLTYRDRDSPFDGTTWRDVATLLIATVREHAEDGFILTAEAATQGENERHIVRIVIEGWAAAELAEADAVRILDHLLHRTDLSDLREEVARLLGDSRPSTSEGDLWPSLPMARQLADTLWPTPDQRDPDELGDDVELGRIISHWGRYLAEFWIQVVAHEWRSAGDAWSGMDQALRTPIDRIVDSETAAGAAGRATLATRLHFLFGADREWTTGRFLPLFDWNEPQTARPVWCAFIAWGRWNDALLDAGLLDGYIEATRRLKAFERDVAERLFDHLAAISLQSGLHPIESGWLTRFTVAVDDDARAQLWHRIAWQLRELPAEVVEGRWADWMERYWAARLDSVPIMLTTVEASAMSTWVPRLGPMAPAAIEFVLRHDAGLEQNSLVLHEIRRGELLQTAAEKVAAYVAHLLSGTGTPFYACGDVAAIISRVRSATGVEPEAIIEQALRLGCPPVMWEQATA